MPSPLKQRNASSPLTRQLSPTEFAGFAGFVFCGLGILFYLRGERIQQIVDEKSDVVDVREGADLPPVPVHGDRTAGDRLGDPLERVVPLLDRFDQPLCGVDLSLDKFTFLGRGQP